MTQTTDTEPTLNDFIDGWDDSCGQVRKAFLSLKSHLEAKSGVTLEFIARQGLTYSLRAVCKNPDRPLFAVIDVIEDDPRWLSVCFYDDMVTDPDGTGDFVPGGLLGEDGRCFDLESCDPTEVEYLVKRIDEAYHKYA